MYLLGRHVRKYRFKEASGLEVVAQSISPQKEGLSIHTRARVYQLMAGLQIRAFM